MKVDIVCLNMNNFNYIILPIHYSEIYIYILKLAINILILQWYV